MKLSQRVLIDMQHSAHDLYWACTVVAGGGQTQQFSAALARVIAAMHILAEHNIISREHIEGLVSIAKHDLITTP